MFDAPPGVVDRAAAVQPRRGTAMQRAAADRARRQHAIARGAAPAPRGPRPRRRPRTRGRPRSRGPRPASRRARGAGRSRRSRVRVTRTSASVGAAQRRVRDGLEAEVARGRGRRSLSWFSESEAEGWCGREDSNLHGVAPASPSSWCVYQFRHCRKERATITERRAHAPALQALRGRRARRRLGCGAARLAAGGAAPPASARAAASALPRRRSRRRGLARLLRTASVSAAAVGAALVLEEAARCALVFARYASERLVIMNTTRGAGGELGEEVAGAAGAEEVELGAAAEDGAHVGALAGLQQHDHDQEEARRARGSIGMT